MQRKRKNITYAYQAICTKDNETKALGLPWKKVADEIKTVGAKDNETKIPGLPCKNITDEIHINFLACIGKGREEPLTKER